MTEQKYHQWANMSSGFAYLTLHQLISPNQQWLSKVFDKSYSRPFRHLPPELSVLRVTVAVFSPVWFDCDVGGSRWDGIPDTLFCLIWLSPDTGRQMLRSSARPDTVRYRWYITWYIPTSVYSGAATDFYTRTISDVTKAILKIQYQKNVFLFRLQDIWVFSFPTILSQQDLLLKNMQNRTDHLLGSLSLHLSDYL